MYCKNNIVILFMLCSLYLSSIAQDTTDDYRRGVVQQQQYQEETLQPNKFDKKDWNQLKKKLEIKNYEPEKKKEEPKKQKTETSWTKSLSPATAKIIQLVVFAILFILLLYLVIRVLGINPFNKKIENKINVELEELEDNLDTAAIDPHLYAAIKNKNFKLAIRLYYLMIIQRLALKEKIVWKKHKTNKHYLNELRNKEEYPVMRKLTLIYERSWFGEADISEADYNILNVDFVNFLQNIK